MQALDDALADARARYAALNPASQAADKSAERFMPGGNTRAVLHFAPFPLTMAEGHGATLTDLDGHLYVDFVGEFSAGLFGHSDERIKAAVREAMDKGIVMGSPTAYERDLAALICKRFRSIDQVRFCNSGTEANLLALAAARAITGRDRILVFRESYHGGVIKFPAGGSALNVPFDYLTADFNDIAGTADLIDRQGADLAAVIVEPILGAGGNIPATREFLEMLRQKTTEVGALLILDEVKTARHGASGIQGMMGIEPDLTTLGKFIAGGLPTGAFGGRREIMARFNPKSAGNLAHAGTFNNNVCSMAAGTVAMGEIYTAERAAEFFEFTEAFRLSLNELFSARSVPMHANGMGSMIAIHFSDKPTKSPADITAGCRSLRPLFHLEMLMAGVLVCNRGDMFLSLPMDDSHLARARSALENFIDRHESVVEQILRG